MCGGGRRRAVDPLLSKTTPCDDEAEIFGRARSRNDFLKALRSAVGIDALDDVYPRVVDR
jgi:hypothetical protein